jgi:hypothetical protein
MKAAFLLLTDWEDNNAERTWCAVRAMVNEVGGNQYNLGHGKMVWCHFAEYIEMVNHH